MRVVVVYESMFGSTHAVAEAIAQGLADCADVSVVTVADADQSLLAGADLLVVGAPTHVHGMSRPSTRKAAGDQAARAGSHLALEAGADKGPGVREWMSSLGRLNLAGAAFDTRLKGSAMLTGRASKRIRRGMSHHGIHVVAPPESFLVDKSGELLDGETGKARAWGERLTWSDCVARIVEHQRAAKA